MIALLLLTFGIFSIDARHASRAQRTRALANNGIVPEGFGKTHFIVGLPHEDLPPYFPATPEKTSVEKAVTPQRVLFSPDDDVTRVLVDLIKQEKKGISIAIFAFTDKSIANALIEAHARGVRVEVVIDPTGIKDRSCKISLLQKAGIPIYIYNPYHDSALEQSALMHHKFVIFDNNSSGPLVWTGSFNFTRAAGTRNQENVVIIDDPHAVARYRAQFAQLKKERCTACTMAFAKQTRKTREI